LIEDALKELSDDYYVDNQYPDYQEYMALTIHWVVNTRYGMRTI
jgi:hypothetical protein